MNYSLPSLKSPLAALGLLMTLGLTAIAPAQAAANTPVPSIEFLGDVYSLAWRSDPTPNYSKTEYLPEGEELPHYTNMLLVESLSNGMDVTQVVRSQVEFIKERQGNDSLAQIGGLIENPSTGEVLLDFLLSGQTENGDLIIEWNAYRYTPYQGADGKKAVLLFGYSKRVYGSDNAQAFFQELDQNRAAMIQEVVSSDTPTRQQGERTE